MSGYSQSLGSLEVALSHAARLLATQPVLAAEQAVEILQRWRPIIPWPRCSWPSRIAPAAIRIARWSACRSFAASSRAGPRRNTNSARHSGASGKGTLRWQRCIALSPSNRTCLTPGSALADHLTAVGRHGTGPRGLRPPHQVRHQGSAPPRSPAAALVENRIPEAEALLREHLNTLPDRRRCTAHAR